MADDGGRREATRSRKKAELPTACRTCARALDTAAERKVGRCASCPPTYDVGLFDRLHAWRSTRAAEAKVPAYAVFTDATLVAIAESAPAGMDQLARVPGVGPTKLDRYGAEILAVMHGGPAVRQRSSTDPSAGPP